MSNGDVKNYYSAKELAGLPGMPGTEQNVNSKARRENWPSQKRAGRGGGREYPLTTLPAATKAHLLKGLIAADPEPAAANLPALVGETLPAVVTESALPALAELKRWQRETMEARVYLMRLVERAVAAGLGVNKSIATIAEQAQEGTLPDGAARMVELANAKRGYGRTLSVSSLKNWWSAWQRSGQSPAVLAPKDLEKTPQKVLTDWVKEYKPGSRELTLAPGLPEWLPYLLDEYRQPTKPSLAQALRNLRRRSPASLAIPSYDQVDRLFEKIPAIYLEKGRMTGAEYKSILGYAERDASEYYPMTVCQIDGHSFKAYTAHPSTGAHFHPEVCAVICLTTKVLVGWSAGLAESWRTVADAFRHAITVTPEKPWGGVMAILEGDRGAGNLAGINSDELFGIFGRIGSTFIAPERGGNPQQRGGIERSNQSVWIRAAKDLITYTGKDMDRGVRKRIYTKLEKDLKAVKDAGQLGRVAKTSELLMSWSEFLEYLEYWVLAYNNTPHTALPKITAPIPGEAGGKPVRRHMTPFEAWAQAVADGWQPVLYEGDLLAHLMMPHERVKVTRCKFTLHGNTYHAYELTQHHGDYVIAAYDIHDASQVWVLDLEERPICTAKWNGNKRHPHPVPVVEKAIMDRENRRAANHEKKGEMIRAESESQRKTLEVVAVREVPRDVIVFEEKQRQREKETETARAGKKLFRDAHQLADDIVRRQKSGEPVSDYESRWIVDYHKSAFGPRRIGLYQADPDCAGRFQEERAAEQ